MTAAIKTNFQSFSKFLILFTILFLFSFSNAFALRSDAHDTSAITPPDCEKILHDKITASERNVHADRISSMRKDMDIIESMNDRRSNHEKDQLRGHAQRLEAFKEIKAHNANMKDSKAQQLNETGVHAEGRANITASVRNDMLAKYAKSFKERSDAIKLQYSETKERMQIAHEANLTQLREIAEQPDQVAQVNNVANMVPSQNTVFESHMQTFTQVGTAINGLDTDLLKDRKDYAVQANLIAGLNLLPSF